MLTVMLVATFGAVRMYSKYNLNARFYTSGIQYLDLSATPDYPLAFSGSVFEKFHTCNSGLRHL